MSPASRTEAISCIERAIRLGGGKDSRFSLRNFCLAVQAEYGMPRLADRDDCAKVLKQLGETHIVREIAYGVWQYQAEPQMPVVKPSLMSRMLRGERS